MRIIRRLYGRLQSLSCAEEWARAQGCTHCSTTEGPIASLCWIGPRAGGSSISRGGRGRAGGSGPDGERAVEGTVLGRRDEGIDVSRFGHERTESASFDLSPRTFELRWMLSF